MKVSLRWLNEYIQVDLDPAVIADKLTMAGLEVDSVERLYDYLDQVVVARVTSTRKHPNADKLTCCVVDAGQGEDLEIVCGAPNVREGMTVACALVGAELPGEFKIKKNKIRGEVSRGMLCSGAELRLDADAAGILDLDSSLEVGTPLRKALNMSDWLFEIDLTPNRPDCLSAIGVAREIAAFAEVNATLTPPVYELPDERIDRSRAITDFARVDILDPDLCPRYSAGMLVDVKVGPSPMWLQQKLESVGLTPVNNVVDITNFVMLETGQPLHAFDYDFLAQGRIEVKKAGSPISFVTLDSKEHKLEPEMLMICDGERPVALAGVMGGENSEITDTTTRVLIESAHFNHISVRRTAKRTGIATDASHRFERGVDPEGTVNAMVRTMALIAETCGATIIDGLIDEYPKKHDPVEIDLDIRALNIRLGTDLTRDAIADILESVEFKVETSDMEGRLKVTAPSFRVDVQRPEDLSEEVARIWGYNNILTTFPEVPAKGKPVNSGITFRTQLRKALTGFGMTEAVNYSFISHESGDRIGLGEGDDRRLVQTILNPISEDMSVLRASLIPGLLETARRNISNQSDTLKLFEVGKVFFAKSTTELPEEREMLGGVITGTRQSQAWYSKKESFDFYDLKGICEGLCSRLKIEDIGYVRTSVEDHPYYEAGMCASMVSGEKIIGSLGKISGRVLKTYGIKQDCYLFDIDVEALKLRVPDSITAQPLPKYPSISQDITMIVDSGLEVGQVLSTMQEMGKKESLVESVSLFDVYEGAPLADGKKSISFRIIYRSDSTTLKEKKVKGLHAKISDQLVKTFNAGLPE